MFEIIRNLFGKSNPRILGQHPNVLRVLFSRDGRTLLSIGDGIKTWDLATRMQLRSIPALGSDETVSPDWKILACSRGKRVGPDFFGNVVLGDLLTGAEVESLPSPFGGLPDEINDLAFSPDGSILACKTLLFGISLWHMADKAWANGHLKTFQLSGGSLRFSPDGQYLSFRNLLWDRSIWRNRDLRGSSSPEIPFKVMAFAPDSRSFASQRKDGKIVIVELGTGRELQTLPGHAGGGDDIDDLTFAPDGKHLASCCRGQREIKLWDLSSGREIRVLTFEGSSWLPIGNWLHSVAFSPDGRMLAFASSYITDRPRRDAPPPVIGLWELAAA